jgi:hypothetical protein
VSGDENCIRNLLCFSRVDFHSHQKCNHGGSVAITHCRIELFKVSGSKQPLIDCHPTVDAKINWLWKQGHC